MYGFLSYFWVTFLPSWIQIRIRNFHAHPDPDPATELMRIRADPHPDTAQDPKPCLSQLIFTSSELSEVLCSQEEERYGTRRGSLAGFLSPFFFFVWGTSALVAEINKMINILSAMQ
jgi:hypothetical protein